MTKTHLAITSATGTASACGRGSRTDTAVAYTTCLNCQNTPEYRSGKAALDSHRLELFNAQEPRRVAEPWTEGNIECGACGGDLFRYRGRTCYGHYEDHVCANCGGVASRLTETGRCF